MKREILEYANLPEKVVSGTVDDVIASVAWMADNEGYGVRDAAKRTIDKLRALSIGLTFVGLSNANAKRLPLFKNARGEQAHSEPDGSDWSLAEWTNAIAGECGEACNIAKKLIRGDYGKPGDLTYQAALLSLAKEFADITIYTDIACKRAGYSLGEVTREKFNEVSHRVKCDVFL